ncbi:MAG: TonB-dependent receptor [Opitutales bacterium]
MFFTNARFRRPIILPQLALLSSVLPVGALHGQDRPGPPEADRGAMEEPIRELDDYVIRANDPDRLALPTGKDADSLFGPHRDALATPRSLSVLSRPLLDNAVIRDLRDIERVSTNTDTPNTFGLPSLPRIRGQEGDIFQNGMHRVGGNNGFGLPISFNAVERLDVVKGPATPVLGPTRRVGGYVDLHTKRPDRFENTGSVTLEVGEYDHVRSVVDTSTVIREGRSALRLSWEHLDAGSFYDFVDTQSDSIYVAYTTRPNERVRIDLNAEYYEADYSDNGGINRPTQELIDSGTYITGTGLSPLFNPDAFDADGQLRPTAELQALDLDPTPGPNAVIRPGLRVNPDGSLTEIDPTVRIDRDRVLTDPEDLSEAETFLVQGTVAVQLSPALTLTNRSHFQTLEKDQVNQNSFVEIIDDLHTLNNRSELAAEFALGGFAHKTTSGLDLRYHQVEAYSQFVTEADNPIDLTAPVASRRIGPAAIARRLGVDETELGTRGLIEIRPGVFASPAVNHDIDGDGAGDFGISDTNETDLFQAGLFHQHDIHFNERWSLLLGGRVDAYHVEGRDPLAPDGFEVEDSLSEALGAFNASLNHAPTGTSNYYATYSFSQSVNSALGGGLTLDSTTGRLNATDFGIDSELWEVGAKYSFLENRAFLSLAAFHQTRSERNRDGSTANLEVAGAEAEFTYQPNRNLLALLGASWIDATFDNEPVSQGTARIEDAFDDSRPAVIAGTGSAATGSPNFTVFPAADHAFPGLPDITLNGLVAYTHESGFGGSLNAQWEDTQNLDVRGRVTIPDQLSVNAAVFYRQPRFEVRLDVFNLTDEENFNPVFDGFFGATLAFPAEPRRFQFSATYQW